MIRFFYGSWNVVNVEDANCCRCWGKLMLYDRWDGAVICVLVLYFDVVAVAVQMYVREIMMLKRRLAVMRDPAFVVSRALISANSC